MRKNCERCKTESAPGTRRFRCDCCSRLTCSKCCNAGGRGQGQGSKRWAECYDCQAKREALKFSGR